MLSPQLVAGLNTLGVLTPGFWVKHSGSHRLALAALVERSL